MAETTFVRTIERLDRMDSSANGNPRYLVTFTDGTGKPTSPDASIAYALPNPEFRGVPVTFTQNGRGHITHAVPVADDKSKG